MPAILSERARDRSTFVVTASFTDEAGSAVTPSAATWTLLGRNNQVINARDAVAILPLAASVSVLLEAADLDYDDGDVRYLVLDWTYSSDLGSGLTGREQVTFFISDIREKAVTE